MRHPGSHKEKCQGGMRQRDRARTVLLCCFSQEEGAEQAGSGLASLGHSVALGHRACEWFPVHGPGVIRQVDSGLECEGPMVAGLVRGWAQDWLASL